MSSSSDPYHCSLLIKRIKRTTREGAGPDQASLQNQQINNLSKIKLKKIQTITITMQ